MNEERGVNDVISRIADWHGVLHCYEDREAITRGSETLRTDLVHCTAMFRTAGVKPGDRIGIMGANSYAWVLLDLASLACGASSVGLDPSSPETMNQITANLGIAHLWNLPSDANAVWLARNAPSAGAFPLARSSSDVDPHVFGREEIVSVKFTSGSTGEPKTIEVKRKSIDDSLSNVQQMFAHGPGDTILVFLPLHLLQQRYWIYSAILFDHDVIVAPYHLAFDALRRHRPTVVMAVPEFFESAIRGFDEDAASDREAFTRLLGGRVRYLWTGSAPIDLVTLHRYDRMGTPLYQGYGMNETCIVAKNYPGHNRQGSVGQVVPSKKVKFSPEGELLVWSENEVNDRYSNRPAEESALTFRPDGYVATGDTGFIDEDGYLFITGRVKDIIVLANGRKVAPIPIEKRLAAYPSIERAVVLGGAASSLVAVVQPRSTGVTREVLAADIAAHNASASEHERIARFVVAPEGITQEQGLLTSQFKVRRQAVEQKFAAQLEALDAVPYLQPEAP